MRLEVEKNVGRHRTTWWGLLDSQGMATARGDDVAIGVLEQLE